MGVFLEEAFLKLWIFLWVSRMYQAALGALSRVETYFLSPRGGGGEPPHVTVCA